MTTVRCPRGHSCGGRANPVQFLGDMSDATHHHGSNLRHMNMSLSITRLTRVRNSKPPRKSKCSYSLVRTIIQVAANLTKKVVDKSEARLVAGVGNWQSKQVLSGAVCATEKGWFSVQSIHQGFAR